MRLELSVAYFMEGWVGGVGKRIVANFGPENEKGVSYWFRNTLLGYPLKVQMM